MKRVIGYASLGLVGCETVVLDFEVDDEELQNAIDSGEIYGWIDRDGVQQVLDMRYEVEDV